MNFAASCISIFIKCVLYITGMQLTKTNDISFKIGSLSLRYELMLTLGIVSHEHSPFCGTG